MNFDKLNDFLKKTKPVENRNLRSITNTIAPRLRDAYDSYVPTGAYLDRINTYHRNAWNNQHIDWGHTMFALPAGRYAFVTNFHSVWEITTIEEVLSCKQIVMLRTYENTRTIGSHGLPYANFTDLVMERLCGYKAKPNLVRGTGCRTGFGMFFCILQNGTKYVVHQNGDYFQYSGMVLGIDKSKSVFVPVDFVIPDVRMSNNVETCMFYGIDKPRAPSSLQLFYEVFAAHYTLKDLDTLMDNPNEAHLILLQASRSAIRERLEMHELRETLKEQEKVEETEKQLHHLKTRATVDRTNVVKFTPPLVSARSKSAEEELEEVLEVSLAEHLKEIQLQDMLKEQKRVDDLKKEEEEFRKCQKKEMERAALHYQILEDEAQKNKLEARSMPPKEKQMPGFRKCDASPNMSDLTYTTRDTFVPTIQAMKGETFYIIMRHFEAAKDKIVEEKKSAMFNELWLKSKPGLMLGKIAETLEIGLMPCTLHVWYNILEKSKEDKV